MLAFPGDITRMEIEGPLGSHDMLVMLGVECPLCSDCFEKGDRWTAMPKGPLNSEEAARAEAGLPFRALCSAVHYDCVVFRLVDLMNWHGIMGEA
jgi:hypothetical protein